MRDVIISDMWKSGDGGDTNELCRQGGLIDSGSSFTVRSSTWLNRRINCDSVGLDDASVRAFRFGDGSTRWRKGVKQTHCALVCQSDVDRRIDVSFQAEVFDGSIPLPISYATLCAWKRGLSFSSSPLLVRRKTMRLGCSRACHIYVEMIHRQEETMGIHSTGDAPNADVRKESDEQAAAKVHITKEQIKKSTAHIGHGAIGAMSRMIRESKYHFNYRPIHAIVGECGCSFSDLVLSGLA